MPISISLDDLANVTGGQGLCQRVGGFWKPTPGNRTLIDGDPRFATPGTCVKRVLQWKHSPMNIDNDVAD